MKNSQGEINFDTLIKVIIVLIVIIVVIGGYYPIYNKLMKTAGVEWEDLAPSEQAKAIDSFDSLVSMLKGCEAKTNCLCGSAKGFPFAFRDEQSISVENKGKSSTLKLMWKNAHTGKEAALNNPIVPNSKLYSFKITFKKGEYLIDDISGIADRPAFSKVGSSFFIFDEKVFPWYKNSFFGKADCGKYPEYCSSEKYAQC